MPGNSSLFIYKDLMLLKTYSVASSGWWDPHRSFSVMVLIQLGGGVGAIVGTVGLWKHPGYGRG